MRHFIFAILLGCVAASAQAQEPKARTIPFQGAEVFCQILHHEGLQPIQLLGPSNRDQTDTLLIVFGKPLPMLKEITDGLPHFLKKGGNLLVITDHEFHSNGLSLRIPGMRVVQPELAYRGKPHCPWLPCAWGGDHPLFATLRKGIATNCPASVAVSEENRALQPLLTFSRELHGFDMRGMAHGRHTLSYMVGSPKDAPPRGRALFIAGQGMFMNGMMLQKDQDKEEFDNDNFDFAVNAIRWLREGPGGAARTRALLMVDGKIVADFNMNLSPRADLPPPQIPVPPVKAVNRLIRGMEEERLFHKILHGLLGDHFDRVIGVLFALATFGLLLYGVKKFLEGRVHRETNVPRMVGATPPIEPGLRRGQQRQLATHDQADSAKESCQLVRAWLQAEFGVHPQQWSAGTNVELRAAGILWSRWGLQRQADELVRVARGAPLVPVPRGQFSHLIETLTTLTAAHHADRLALLVDGKSTSVDPVHQEST